MSKPNLPDEFWEVFDLARERAELHPAWNLCQMERLFALDQACVPDEHENTIKSTSFHEMIMIVHELYQIMVDNKART